MLSQPPSGKREWGGWPSKEGRSYVPGSGRGSRVGKKTVAINLRTVTSKTRGAPGRGWGSPELTR